MCRGRAFCPLPGLPEAVCLGSLKPRTLCTSAPCVNTQELSPEVPTTWGSAGACSFLPSQSPPGLPKSGSESPSDHNCCQAAHSVPGTSQNLTSALSLSQMGKRLKEEGWPEVPDRTWQSRAEQPHPLLTMGWLSGQEDPAFPWRRAVEG